MFFPRTTLLTRLDKRFLWRNMLWMNLSFFSSEISSKLGNARYATLTTESSWLDSPVNGRLSFAMATPAKQSLVTDLNARLLNFNFHAHSGPWLLPRIDVVRGSSDGNRPPLVLSSWSDGWFSELRWPGRVELFLAFVFLREMSPWLSHYQTPIIVMKPFYRSMRKCW